MRENAADFVLLAGPPPVRTAMTSNSLRVVMRVRGTLMVGPGGIVGRVTWQKRLSGPAPSIRAASCNSAGTDCRAAVYTTVVKAIVIQLTTTQIESVANAGVPSHEI